MMNTHIAAAMIVLLQWSSAFALPVIGKGSWAVSAGNVEDGLRSADGAFVGSLECYDVELESGVRISATCRIVSDNGIWGGVPPRTIELRRRSFFVHAGGSSGRPSPFDFIGSALNDGARSFPLVVLWKNANAHVELVYALLPAQTDSAAPADDLLVIRDLELQPDAPESREQLIAAVIMKKSSKLVWSYALRRLAKLEDDAVRRFDLVFHPRIQEFAPRERLEYGRDLVTTTIRSFIGDASYERPSPKERRAIFFRLLETLEDAPSVDMAQTALRSFVDQAARNAGFTDQQWEGIRGRIRTAISNPDHVLHKLDDEARERANTTLERVLGEPNLLDLKP